jgi:hypothetical protein
MGFRDLINHALDLVILWVMVIILTVIIIILFSLQQPYINRPSTDPAKIKTARDLGTGLAIVSLIAFAIGSLWIVLYIVLARNVQNISRDASSIYVSRSTILTNWFGEKAVTTGQAISGYTDPSDGGSLCFSTFAVPNAPDAYDGYKALIKSYQSGGFKQVFEAPDSTLSPQVGGGTTGTFKSIQPAFTDTMENQQKLSLAFYRLTYCTKAYFDDVLSGDYVKNPLPFLSTTTQGNLKAKKSNCGYSIPDTTACQNSAAPGSVGCIENYCFTALNEAIAAQCLLYDDHVYRNLNGGSAKGVLGAMDLQGFQVRGPDIASKP